MHHVLVFDICSLSPMTSRGWLEAEGTARSEQLHFTASRTRRADALISEGPLWASEVWQFDSSMLVYNEIKLFWLLAACVCQYVIAETAHFLNIKRLQLGVEHWGPDLMWWNLMWPLLFCWLMDRSGSEMIPPQGACSLVGPLAPAALQVKTPPCHGGQRWISTVMLSCFSVCWLSSFRHTLNIDI